MALAAAEFRATVGQHAAELDPVLLEERHHPIVQEIGRSAVLEARLAPADLLQSQFPAFLVELFEPIEAVSAIAHHLAGLAHVAELLGELQ
jgi:hypothetical protein